MDWIVHKDFERRTLSGYVSARRGDRVEEKDGAIFLGNRLLCFAHSNFAKENMAPDYDGRGLERGDITSYLAFGPPLSEIQKSILRTDPSCSRFIDDNPETILFNDLFFQAPMLDLYTVCSKLGVKL